MLQRFQAAIVARSGRLHSGLLLVLPLRVFLFLLEVLNVLFAIIATLLEIVPRPDAVLLVDFVEDGLASELEEGPRSIVFELCYGRAELPILGLAMYTWGGNCSLNDAVSALQAAVEQRLIAQNEKSYYSKKIEEEHAKIAAAAEIVAQVQVEFEVCNTLSPATIADGGAFRNGPRVLCDTANELRAPAQLQRLNARWSPCSELSRSVRKREHIFSPCVDMCTDRHPTVKVLQSKRWRSK